MPRIALSIAALLASDPAALAGTPGGGGGVTGGSPDHGDAAVVALVATALTCDPLAPPAQTFCSGTLVGGRAVLTAAHCLEAAPLAGVRVYAGSSIEDDASAWRAVATARVDPDSDLAIVVLEEGFEIPPVPLAAEPDPLLTVGAAVRIVGFGRDDAGRTGTKRSGTAQVTAVEPSRFEVMAAPAMSCTGDSGGPVFMALAGSELVVGVTSFGDVACSTGTNVRTDARSQTFLVPNLEEIASMTTTRAPIRPDQAYCEEECTSDLDCPQRMTCTQGTSERRTCALTGLQAGQFAGACAETGACAGGLCVALDDGACRCWQPCGASPDRSGAGCSAAPRSGAGLGWAITLVLAHMLFTAGGCRGANGQPGGKCPPDAVSRTATVGDTVQDWCEKRTEPTVRHGPFVEWFDAGRAHKKREGRFVSGAQDGTWTSWYEDGQVERQITYAQGVMHGPTTAYHHDGVQQEAGAYREGRRVGHWTAWHETGAVKRETDYLEGGREERWRAFTEAGALLQDGVFVDARRHGPFAEYHPNGSKAAEGRYEVGQKVGEWRYWSADGQPVSGD